MNDHHEQIRIVLQRPHMALVNGDFAVVYHHDRWHLLTFTYFGWEKGIHTINFMSEAHARPELSTWSQDIQPIPFSQVSDIFQREVEIKILAEEEYLPLLERSLVDIGGGPTTDMMSLAGHSSADQESFLAHLSDIMTTGRAGPLLQF